MQQESRTETLNWCILCRGWKPTEWNQIGHMHVTVCDDCVPRARRLNELHRLRHRGYIAPV